VITADVVEENPIPADPDTPGESATRSKNFALKFTFLKDKLKADANTEQYKSTVTSTQNNQTGSAPDAMDEEQTAPK
jgi:hypothetical protein